MLLHSWSIIHIYRYCFMYRYSMHVCVVIRVRINRVRLPNLFEVNSTEIINISLSPFAPEDSVSRDRFGRPVLRQPACSFSTLRLRIWCSRDSSRFVRRRLLIYPAIRHRVSPEFIGSPNLRADDVHCRESVGTAPVIFKVV